jgi:hypothetical protein
MILLDERGSLLRQLEPGKSYFTEGSSVDDGVGNWGKTLKR